MENTTNNSKSSLILNNRNTLSLTAVKKVKSTEPTCVIADLDNCAIVITGNNLTVQNVSISAGSLDLTGNITGIKFTNTVSKKFSLKNMFR